MANQLTPQQIVDFERIFAFLDNDGSGSITPEKLGSAFSSVGLNAGEAGIQKIMLESDADGDGNIDLYEFLSLMARWVGNPVIHENISETFKKFDTDGDGLITLAELRFALNAMGENLTDKELEEIIMEVDLDGDGCINYEEFARMMGY